jgi:hypothetical protein
MVGFILLYTVIGINIAFRHHFPIVPTAIGCAVSALGVIALTLNLRYERRREQRGELYCKWIDLFPAAQRGPSAPSGGIPGPLGLWRPR